MARRYKGMSNRADTISSVPTLSADGNLQRYLSEIRKFPMLAADEEYMLAKRWKEHGDVDAVHKMVTSHLRLVAKIAMGYRGYGLPIAELISEGNVGMMQAVKRFEPEKGFRLSTYAMWWIRASIQEYILYSWSLVKMGTTAAQKKLFFNLRRLKGQIKEIDDGDLAPESVKQIATTLAVSEDDVVQMNRRMSGGDQSLNAPMRQDGEAEWQDWLVDDSDTQDIVVAEADELDHRRSMLEAAMATLTERERHIFTERRLRDDPVTLEDLSNDFGVSRERVRQIEVRAFEKVQRAIRNMATQDVIAQTKATERFRAD
jgi:RNA polymerase sigma-32 factor